MAKCDACGESIPRRVLCPDCLKAVKAAAKPTHRSPIRHCSDCGVWKGGKFVIAKPKPHCRECLQARGLAVELSSDS